ncbi:MAG: zinc ribbon domain-containing protein [Candidatus Omnitrophica bacterium]|nr:zinc ribbon domain-containing protein [Candidatus Omnitrophota bacterium]
MPTYEYRCLKCKRTFERLQKMSEAPVKECVFCKGKKVERLIGAGAGLIFKGSGFYVTDYKKSRPGSGEKKPEAKKEAAPSSSSSKNA